MLSVIPFVALFISSGDAQTVECEASFGGYSHPDWWCSDPLCATAPDESPIDIDTDNTFDGYDENTCSSYLPWEVDWDHSLFKVENNCNTIKLTPMGFDDSDVLTPFTDSSDAIAILGTEGTPFEGEYKDYCLAQFHFHWGDNSEYGSEHHLDGEAFPLEAHFVHYACEFGTFDAAQAEGKRTTLDGQEGVDHTLAVVGVLFEISEEDNPAFEAILSDAVMAQIQDCRNEDSEAIINKEILDDLIPDGLETGGYYAYKGSLTTPPCTDDVNWFIMKTFGRVSESQMERFRAMIDDEGDAMSRNWRDIQDNANDVTECTGGDPDYKRHGSSSESNDSDDDDDESGDSDDDDDESGDDENSDENSDEDSDEVSVSVGQETNDKAIDSQKSSETGAAYNMNDSETKTEDGFVIQLAVLVVLCMLLNVVLVTGFCCKMRKKQAHHIAPEDTH